MNDTLQYNITIHKNGKWSYPTRMMPEVIEEFGRDDRDVHCELIFKKRRSRSSNKQRGYYRSILLPFIMIQMRKTGNEIQLGNKKHEEVVHKFLTKEFMPEKANSVELKIGKDVWKEPKSTSGDYADTVMFKNFIESIIAWCFEIFNVHPPLPNEKYQVGDPVTGEVIEVDAKKYIRDERIQDYY